MREPIPETGTLGANLASIVPDIGTFEPKDPSPFKLRGRFVSPDLVDDEEKADILNK